MSDKPLFSYETVFPPQTPTEHWEQLRDLVRTFQREMPDLNDRHWVVTMSDVTVSPVGTAKVSVVVWRNGEEGTTGVIQVNREPENDTFRIYVIWFIIVMTMFNFLDYFG